MDKVSSYSHANSETGFIFFFFLKTVPACLLCIYICSMVAIAGNADMAFVCMLQI